MKNNLLAVAVAGALASPAAFAQSNVTIYGGIDVGYQRASGYASGDVEKNFVQSGQWYTSRLGLRASDDLAPGVTARFVIEAGILADTGGQEAASPTVFLMNSSGAFWNRQAYGGIESKQMGSITLGRQYTHMFHAYEVGTGTVLSLAGTLTPALTNSLRAANSVKYSSPKFGGLTVGAMWSPQADTVGESVGVGDNNQYWDANVMWVQGPFGVAVARSNLKGETAAASADLKRTQFTAKWDAGTFGVMGGYATNKADATAGFVAEQDLRNMWIQPVFRFGGKNEIYGLWAKVTDKLTDDSDTTVWGVAYRYLMTKRSYAYAAYGRADNDGLAARAPTTFAGTTTAGQNPSGFQVGVATTF